MIQMARPTIEELWKAYKTALSGLTGSGVFIMDMQGAPSPMLKNVPAPRFSAAYEVKNRAALGEAWQKVANAAKTVVTLASQGKMAELPAPQSSEPGGKHFRYPLGGQYAEGLRYGSPQGIREISGTGSPSRISA